MRALVPLLPLYQAKKDTLFEKGLSTVRDPAAMDRIRLGFAGICNAMIAAQILSLEDPDHLVKTCREAAGYLNLAMERLSGIRIRGDRRSGQGCLQILPDHFAGNDTDNLTPTGMQT
jgi:hypothetical protein